MVSSSIIYTFVFTMGFLLLINSMHAASINNRDDSDDQDDGSYSVDKRAADHKDYSPDEYQGIMLDRRGFAPRGARLPSESILLGKRRLPSESILLGKRRLPSESILLGRRRLPSESILLGKRRLPVEAVLLGRRNLPNEAIFLGKRR